MRSVARLVSEVLRSKRRFSEGEDGSILALTAEPVKGVARDKHHTHPVLLSKHACATAKETTVEGMRTDRLSLLVDQLDRAREMAEVRLTGLGDEEYLWEPAPGAWSIRRRGEAASSRPFGPGEWVLDRGDPEIPAAEYAEIDRQVRGGVTVAKVATDWGVSHQRVEEILNRVGPPEPDLAPVTTIAWRVGHLHSDFAGRWEWTFGERRRQPDLLVDFAPSATVAVERFWALMDRWRDSVEAMTPEHLDTPGFGQYPWGSDPDEPFIVVIWGANLEFIHHMAEIALLRDLWRARSASGGEAGRKAPPGARTPNRRRAK